MKRLLILACSQRKNPAPGLMPAIDRYDGPAFRVLRKFLAERPPSAPVVLVLSAKFGLIEVDQPIPDYDLRMSSALAGRLRPMVLDALARVLKSRRWESVSLCVGKDYHAAVDGFEQWLPEAAHFELLGGGLGKRLANLHRWLRDQGHSRGGAWVERSVRPSPKELA